MAAATLRPNQRGHILDVTLRIMSEQGAAKTSMRQLARECGINVATLYHYVFGWSAPYAWTSLPKVLGTSGGVLLCLGTTAQAWLARRRHESTKDLAAAGMDVGLIALLFIVSASGLAMAAAHHTPALPLLLAIHLGAVLAFFLTLPYGKFAHGAYRAAALLLWSIERRQPAQVNLGTD